MPFRGKCKFLQYMPSKPSKYRIKIFWMCDAEVSYVTDGMVYTGRQPGEELQKNLGETVVQQLCTGIRQTGECKYNIFSLFLCSCQCRLAKELVLPHMIRCLESTPTLQRHITEAMERCGVKKENTTTTQLQDTRQEGPTRTRCKICPLTR